MLAVPSTLPSEQTWARDGGPVAIDDEVVHLVRAFPSAAPARGVEGVRFHDLRHTVATMLMGSVHPKVVSELLGHSDVATTPRVYSHAAAAMHQEAADTLGALVVATAAR